MRGVVHLLASGARAAEARSGGPAGRPAGAAPNDSRPRIGRRQATPGRPERGSGPRAEQAAPAGRAHGSGRPKVVAAEAGRSTRSPPGDAGWAEAEPWTDGAAADAKVEGGARGAADAGLRSAGSEEDPRSSWSSPTRARPHRRRPARRPRAPRRGPRRPLASAPEPTAWTGTAPTPSSPGAPPGTPSSRPLAERSCRTATSATAARRDDWRHEEDAAGPTSWKLDRPW